MYSVGVKIDGIESRRRNAGLLHIVTGFFLFTKSVDYYRFLGYQTIIPALPFFAVAFISLLYGFARRRIDLTAKHNYLIRFLQVISFTTLGFAFIKIARPVDYAGLFIFAIISITLLISERRIFIATTIIFDDNGIKIPGYYRDHVIIWESISEIIVREDFVTIFHRKQKYLQYQVIQDLSILEVAKMNTFCREKVEETRNKKQEIKVDDAR